MHPELVVTTNDRRRYLDPDVQALNVMLVNHQHQVNQLIELYRQDCHEIVRANVFYDCTDDSGYEVPAGMDEIVESVRRYCETADYARFLYDMSKCWLQLLLGHQADLVRAGFRLSDATSRINVAIIHATVAVDHHRNYLRRFGLPTAR
ncbi:MAG: hypothetical protein ABIR91_05400 [Candidatus Saccharimonadales bacterium]